MPFPLKYVWRVVRKIFGIILILIGIVGLFLPILQGILFIILGAALLGIEKSRLLEWKTAALSRWHGFQSWLKRNARGTSCWVLVYFVLASCAGIPKSEPSNQPEQGPGVSNKGEWVESKNKPGDPSPGVELKAGGNLRVRAGIE